MDCYIHPTKREKIEWLHWFYDGKYTKAQIKRKNYVGWYFKLRITGAIKPSKGMALSAK